MAARTPKVPPLIKHLYTALDTLEKFEGFSERAFNNRYGRDLGCDASALHIRLMKARAVIVRHIVEQAADLAAAEDARND